MLFYCEYTWLPGTTQQRVAERFQQQEEAGLHHPEKWRGWYALTGGGAGFLVVETNDEREVTAMLQPYMDVLKWDVRSIYELKYETMKEQLRQTAAAGSAGMSSRT